MPEGGQIHGVEPGPQGIHGEEHDRRAGELSVDWEFECFTLEDKVHEGPKIPGKTAIPAGTYKVINSFSPRFQCYLPLLLNVPGFEGLRIHPGNKCEDTEGCILVGETKDTDFIGNSRRAFKNLFAKMKAAETREVITLTIQNE